MLTAVFSINLTVDPFGYSPYGIPITTALDPRGVRNRTVEVAGHRRDAIIKLSGGRCCQVPFVTYGLMKLFAFLVEDRGWPRMIG